MIKWAKSANTSTSHNINKQHELDQKSSPLSIMGMTFDPLYIIKSKNSGDCLPSILTITATFACNS